MQVRGYFLVFVQLFEKYGTLIDRYTALIEKVSASIAARACGGAWCAPPPPQPFWAWPMRDAATPRAPAASAGSCNKLPPPWPRYKVYMHIVILHIVILHNIVISVAL
eukprot:SAG31_NODE_12418_length_943_cov_1.648104_2_plen_108_part_00